MENKKFVHVFHIGIDGNIDIAEVVKTIDRIKKEHPEILGAGYHGTKEFDPEYSTQV